MAAYAGNVGYWEMGPLRVRKAGVGFALTRAPVFRLAEAGDAKAQAVGPQPCGFFTGSSRSGALARTLVAVPTASPVGVPARRSCMADRLTDLRI